MTVALTEEQSFRDLTAMEEVAPHMSNLDYTIDGEMENALRARPGKVWSQHAAWNFCGYVWFEHGAFTEQVWVYGSPRREISAPSLRELMDQVNQEYGSE